MDNPVSDIARRLGDNAEAVCRRYLSAGRREGRYWLVGDIANAPGRSLYVRLAAADGCRAPGKWTDAATGDHGDLLDVIAARCGHAGLRETLAEARRFLSLPLPPATFANPRFAKVPSGTPEAARRLWAATKPLADSVAGLYLSGRHIVNLGGITSLRFHPHCYYRGSKGDRPDVRQAWPALIAAVTDTTGLVTGVHRTWIEPDGSRKADIAYPRRAMGHLLGHGVRFGAVGPVMAAGEGIETILSVRQILPAMPMIAGLSGAHLAAIVFPPGLRRLYVARDMDSAGAMAFAALAERAEVSDIDIVPLEPALDDFNDDLQLLGREQLAAAVRAQLSVGDRQRFLR